MFEAAGLQCNLSTVNEDDLPDVLLAEEVAALLRVNRKTLYEAVARGEIPAMRIGRCLRFSRVALEEWMSRKGLPVRGRKK